MYARLTLSNGWISWDAPQLCLGFLAPEALARANATPHLGAATRILGDVFNTAPGTGDEATVQADKTRIFGVLGDSVPWLEQDYLQSPERFDFAVRCLIAHHRLPAIQRQAREARIATTIDGVLGDSPGWIARCGPRWVALKALGVLLPDAVMEPELHTMAAHMVAVSCMEAVLRSHDSPLSPLMRVMRLPGLNTGKTYGAFFEIMANVYLNCPPAGRPLVVELASAALQQKQIEWVVLASEALLKVGANLVSGATHSACLVNILRQSLHLTDFKLRQQVVQFELDRLLDDRKACLQQVVQSSIDAVLAGVPLGAAYCQQIRQALSNEQQANELARQGQDAAQLRARRDATHDQPATADLDPVHAWSVERLLAWIEGPVTRQPIDRPRLLARERERHQVEAARQPAPARPAPPHGTPTDEDDFNLTVDDALQATAAFFRDDLSEMLALGNNLKLDKSLLVPGQQLREALARLASRHEAVHDEEARGLLAHAETAITQLRAAVKRVDTTLKQRMGFTQALHAALRQEPLVAGKRHGGVIAYPMPLDSWGWVSETFHGQWLFQHHQLQVNTRLVPLRADQALALYVTGSSQSNFAFDVSVHLWQRRPGATSMPGVASGGTQRMNTDDWYDTWITCAVLHVPPGR